MVFQSLATALKPLEELSSLIETFGLAPGGALAIGITIGFGVHR